jgi:transposase
MEFKRQFPDDDACLEWLWRNRFAADGHTATCPKCERLRRFHRLAKAPAYSCDTCGHHLHPTAGTIFHKSSTALWLWFYAMYLVSSTRCGISAKQLERQIGVTYKTAWRILNLIRNRLMEQDGEPLSGDVEADETAWGGKPRRGDVVRYARSGESDLSGAGGRWRQANKTTVFGIVERGGKVRAQVVPNRGAPTLQGRVHEHVLPASTIFTDEWPAYRGLSDTYTHRRIRHSEQIYVSGDVHTQTIEGFFSNLKRGISGIYHAVSTKWLPSYLNEFVWRYNHRNDSRAQFESLLLLAVWA